jgi:hypothetical protein
MCQKLKSIKRNSLKGPAAVNPFVPVLSGQLNIRPPRYFPFCVLARCGLFFPSEYNLSSTPSRAANTTIPEALAAVRSRHDLIFASISRSVLSGSW